jgi:hypothetical protein
MNALAFVASSSIALGLLAFCAWTVRVYVSLELDPSADLTSRLVYRHGQAVIWLAALLTGGAVLGVTVRAVWGLLA